MESQIRRASSHRVEQDVAVNGTHKQDLYKAKGTVRHHTTNIAHVIVGAVDGVVCLWWVGHTGAEGRSVALDTRVPERQETASRTVHASSAASLGACSTDQDGRAGSGNIDERTSPIFELLE